MKIGIIGAGAAGLAAALDLSSGGHKVVVYESAPFIGGQASTVQVGGGPLERGYHHLFTNDFAIIGLMAELGIGDRLKSRRFLSPKHACGKTLLCAANSKNHENHKTARWHAFLPIA